MTLLQFGFMVAGVLFFYGGVGVFKLLTNTSNKKNKYINFSSELEIIIFTVVKSLHTFDVTYMVYTRKFDDFKCLRIMVLKGQLTPDNLNSL